MKLEDPFKGIGDAWSQVWKTDTSLSNAFQRHPCPMVFSIISKNMYHIFHMPRNSCASPSVAFFSPFIVAPVSLLYYGLWRLLRFLPIIFILPPPDFSSSLLDKWKCEALFLLLSSLKSSSSSIKDAIAARAEFWAKSEGNPSIKRGQSLELVGLVAVVHFRFLSVI